MDLRYEAIGEQAVPVWPSVSANLSGGVWTGNLVVRQGETEVRLRADDAFSHAGMSNPFDMTPVSPPRLLIERGGNSAIISWPGAAFAYTLEKAVAPGTDDADDEFLKRLVTRKELQTRVTATQLEQGMLAMVKLLPNSGGAILISCSTANRNNTRLCVARIQHSFHHYGNLK